MADENSSLDEKKVLSDFPPNGLLEVVVTSFPKPWRGVFASLNSEHFAVQAGSFWLQEKSLNIKQSDISPNFIYFIDHLVSDFPVVLNEKLFFRPKILLLPLNMQRNTLAFILFHSFSVPLQSLEKLVECLTKYAAELHDWRLTYLKILKSTIKESIKAGNDGLQDMGQSSFKEPYRNCSDLISQESRARFDDLVEKNKQCESSRNISCLSSAYYTEVRDGKGNQSKSEQCLLFEGFNKKDSSRGDNFDMVDLTDVLSQNGDEKVDKELQANQNHGKNDTINVSEDEVMRDLENTSKIVEIERDMRSTRELIVPPPPDYLIIEDDVDVPEQSKFDADILTDSLIKEQAVDPLFAGSLGQTLTSLKELLHRLEAGENDNCNELKVFTSCSSHEMECICSQLNLGELQESTTISLCRQFVSFPTDASFGNASVFAKCCLLPKIQGLRVAASRDMFSAISQFAEKYSRAFCDGVLLRLLQQGNFGDTQVMLVNKIVKESLSEETRLYLLQLVTSIKMTAKNCAFSWTEDTVSVVQTLVDLKPEMSNDLFHTFSRVLEVQSHNLSKSVKFSKMLLAVVKSYRNQVSLYVNCFMHIFGCNETFLKKAGLSALNKISRS